MNLVSSLKVVESACVVVGKYDQILCHPRVVGENCNIWLFQVVDGFLGDSIVEQGKVEPLIFGVVKQSCQLE